MTLPLGRADIEQFRDIVARRLGLRYDDGRLDQLAEVLRQRVELTRCASGGAYLQRIASPRSGREELRIIAASLSVPETYFFRYAAHFRAFTEVVLPDRLRARAGSRRLRILSAGCASGEEPYSLAMMMRESIPELGSWDVSITGIDFNPAVLERAAQARYSYWSLRETPDAMRDRYMRSEGRDYVLDDAVRAMVRFEERNLLDEDPSFWIAESFDVVFCRNVLMYFEPEAARAVVNRIARSLAPGGWAFLGHAETLRGISQGFHLRHTHETFYYQRRDAGEPAPSQTPRLDGLIAPLDPPPLVPMPSDSWIEAIRNASERIEALAKGSVPRSSAMPTASARREALDLGVPLDLLRRERFTEALDALHLLPSEAQSDPDTLLLRAVLLTNAGQPDSAEKVCRQLLALDELHAGAHYLLALCREAVGDPSGAAECDKAALYLDPGFAMAWLHTGLIARRSGDATAARAALDQARVLLDREDASRILLYGGGFSREALVQFCRAELRAAGGAT